MFHFSQTSRDRMVGVNQDLLAVASLAIQITKVDFGIPELGGVRTTEEQNTLYLNGKSKADGKMDMSRHQSGDALDFYAYVDGKASWQEDHLAMVACAFLQSASMLNVSLSWGGMWSSNKTTNGIPYGWDMAHIEIG